MYIPGGQRYPYMYFFVLSCSNSQTVCPSKTIFIWVLVADDKDQNGARLVAVACMVTELHVRKQTFATSQREPTIVSHII